jgi:hypothetical protein
MDSSFKLEFFRFHESINNWAKENYNNLITLKRDLQLNPSLQKKYNEYYEKLIIEYPILSEVRDFPDGVRYMKAAFIFVELSRTFFLLNYNLVMKESDILKNAKENDEREKDLLILWKFDQTKSLSSVSLTWDKPVFRFTQSEIITGLLVLTEHLNFLPYEEGLNDLKMASKILYLRNAIFFCQELKLEILDSTDNFNIKFNSSSELLTPNRDYYTFCTIYFHAIFRRIFYGELIQKLNVNKLPEEKAIERCKAWIAGEVCDGLGLDGFDDLYDKSYEEAYRFPGDLEWFKYKYPDQASHTGPILDCFRKEYSKKFYAEHRTSKEAVLNTVGLNNHVGLCSYCFILNAVDQYFKTSFQLNWRDCICIENSAIEGTQKIMLRGKVPYLVQFFSKYYCFHKGQVFITDCVYTSIVNWLWVLRKYYKGFCLTVDCNQLIDKILDGKEENKIVFF